MNLPYSLVNLGKSVLSEIFKDALVFQSEFISCCDSPKRIPENILIRKTLFVAEPVLHFTLFTSIYLIKQTM